MKGLFKVVFISILCFYSVAAFSNGIKKDAGNNSDTSKISSLLIGADYSSNTNTFGRVNNYVKQPNYSPYLSFYHKSGLFVNSNLNLVGNSDTTSSKITTEFNLMGGIDWRLSNVFTITPGFSHYFYEKQSTSLSSLYNNYAEVNLQAQTKHWSGSISAGYLWGYIDEVDVNAQTSVLFTINHIFSKDDYFTIEPMVGAYINNPNYYSKLFYFLGEYANNHPDARKGNLVADLYNIRNMESEVRYLRQYFRSHPGLGKMTLNLIPNGVPIYDVLNSKNVFTVSSLIFSLPVSYTIGGFSANFNFSLLKPVNQPFYLPNDVVTYFTAGVSYSFQW